MPCMLWLHRFALGVALAVVACVAAAQGGDGFPTGLDLVKRCNALTQVSAEDSGDEADAELDPERVEDYGYCLGYLVGFVSGFAARTVGGETSQFCPPENAKIRDFSDAIQGWLVEHPEGLEKLGAYVATSAFKSKFPCRSP
jgi:Rap1a immunity proteins